MIRSTSGVVSSKGLPDIVLSGLKLYLDTFSKNSYTGAGDLWRDLSGSGINGTLVGATYDNSSIKSFSFDGNNDKVTFPNVTLDTSNGITTEVWFKTSSPTKYQDIFDFADSYGVWITTNYPPNSGKITTSFNTATGVMTATYSTNTWYQVVISGSGNSNSFYLNGVLQDTDTQPVVSSINFNTARLGNVDGDRAAEYLEGNISMVLFYNRALSETEIQKNFNALRNRHNI